MSTSDLGDFGYGDLPDVETLTRLANQLFSTLPGAAVSGVSSSDALASVPQSAPHGQGGVTNIRHPQTSLPDPHGLIAEERVPSVARQQPRSEAGVGTSASAIAASAAPRGNTGNGQPARQSDGRLHVPANLWDGSGLPFAEGIALPYENQLREVLETLRQPRPSTGPATPSSHNPQYYFLEHARFVPPGISTHGATSHPLGEQLAGAGAGLGRPPLDVELVRRDFPILQERINGRQLVWLDNAATTQKPTAVIERLRHFYQHENSNVHRGAHELAARSTDAYEDAREKVRAFLGARSTNECIFVRGATEAINLVAQSWGEQHIGEGDEIIVSWLEHHANIVPWHRLAEKKGAKLRVIPVDDDGQVLLDEYAKLLSNKTKLVAFTQVSNALGTITPAKRIIEMAHSAGAKVLVDGAQSVSHMRVDVQNLNADFFVFSGHKVFGPTGIGVLYGKEELLNSMPPWQGGGNMIKDVTFERIQYHDAPGRFEAGTGNIADAVGLGAALEYIGKLGMDAIAQYEHYLLLYATRLLKDIPGLRLIGTAPDKASVVSFVLDGYKTEEVGALLNREGIAVRSGHHCAQPILRRFGVEGTVRPSLAFYNNCADVDRLIAAVTRIASGRGFSH
jgi:cysteine desulfurase/selenocysteine lyase